MKLSRLVLALVLCVAVLGVAGAADDILKVEKIGPLRYDAPQSLVLKAFGKPARKSVEVLEAATGLFVQKWSYSGLEVGMASTQKGAAKTVVSVTVTAPRTALQTARGVHVGSSEAEVRKAYAKEMDASQSSSGQVVVGSVYGGIIFTIRNGKVSQIFLGAAAE